jgi:hypothetical protein
MLACQNQNNTTNHSTKTEKVLTQNKTQVLEKYKIPQEVLNYLKTYLSDYQAIDTLNYSLDWKSCDLHYSHNELPFYTKLNFNEDQQSDYAFLLIKERKLKLVILLSDKKNFKHIILDTSDNIYQPNSKNIAFGLKVQKTGISIGLGEKVEIKYEGIKLIKFGASSVCYYYDENRKITKFWLGT